MAKTKNTIVQTKKITLHGQDVEIKVYGHDKSQDDLDREKIKQLKEKIYPKKTKNNK